MGKLGMGKLGRFYLCLSALISVLSILAVPASAQGGVRVTAEVDRTAVSTDDSLTLTLSVAGDFQQLGEPQLPLLAGFNLVGSSRSSQFSMVNGVVSARTVFTYQLQPTGPGEFTIDPIRIQVNGSPYQTDPITVQVVQGAAPTVTPAPPVEGQNPAPGGLTGQDLYVEADVDNPAPFVGQQIIYRFRFYQGVNLFNQPGLDWPSFSGFWTEDLSPNNVYEQIAGGRRYRVTEVRRALFPTAAGAITIEPSSLTIPGDFFSRDVGLETQPVGVDVQPLPDGAPDGFTGAVGQLTLAASVEPTKARVNEPVTLRVRVAGTGNLATLPDPTAALVPALTDWRVYDPQTTTNVGQDGDGDTIRGEKQFERLLVPKTGGELTIPPFTLVFFDPVAGEYRQINTEALVVRVAPGDAVAPAPLPNGENKRDVTLLGSDIRHIKAAPSSLATRRTALLEQPGYWLGWLAPFLVLAGVWAWDRRRQRLAGDVALARAQRARRMARKHLAQARKGFVARGSAEAPPKPAQPNGDENAVYAAVARALTEYVADKLNLPAAGLTRAAIRETLTAQAVPGALVDQTLACLDWADSGRFAPTAAGRKASELVSEAEKVIGALEQTIP